jgi:hypothetical protein
VCQDLFQKALGGELDIYDLLRLMQEQKVNNSTISHFLKSPYLLVGGSGNPVMEKYEAISSYLDS